MKDEIFPAPWRSVGLRGGGVQMERVRGGTYSNGPRRWEGEEPEN